MAYIILRSGQGEKSELKLTLYIHVYVCGLHYFFFVAGLKKKILFQTIK